MKYRAAFFDRDGTLLYMDSALRAARRGKLESWTGRPFSQSYEEMMELFRRAGYPETGLKSVEQEISFWRRYYRVLLEDQGVADCLEERAGELWEMCWLKGYKLFPEVLEVLDWFRGHGVRMGVISDTSPSLPLTLAAAGISDYFDCAICSDLVGAMKPDPLIYRTALDALGVMAEESLYVDDYDVEADGARALGFTSFYIDRSCPGDGGWRIASLKAMIDFVEKSDGSSSY